MLVLMAVSLYTSRVVLEALGVEDYGIYNVVGGIVVMFTFINNAMVTSTQRYLNYEIGRNDVINTQKVFSISVNIHVLIALFILVLSETIGLWFLNTTIHYPESRELAVHVIYQLSILTTCVKIIRAPYNAAIIAYEKMSFYAYLSILEAVLQLLIVYLLRIMPFDSLIMYSLLLLFVAIIINLCYYAYSRVKFQTCAYVFTKDKSLYRQLLSFSGWSLFGGVANISAGQGLNMILNYFFGVIVNAALGIANQVGSALSSFIVSFQTAFKPQLVKSYASGDIEYFNKLILSSSKYSYLLSFVLALPIFICCPEVLSIWLTAVPDYSVAFCRLMLIFSILDALQGPLWYSVLAVGKIKNYQIIMSLMILSNLPISYVCIKLGCQPSIVLTIRCIINFASLFVRLWYLKRLFNFPVKSFVSGVIARILPITIIASLLYWQPLNVDSAILKVLIIGVESIAINFILILIIGLNKSERAIILNKIYEFNVKHKRNH